MSFDSLPASPTSSARSRPVDTVDTVAIGAAVVRFLAPGSYRAGRYGLFRWDIAPKAGGPAPHLHRTFSEAFYILDETVLLTGGARWRRAGAGDYFNSSEGSVHAFRNDSEAPAPMLIVFAPGAPRERYFRELAPIAGGGRTLSSEEWTELYARHDQYMV
jgi:quercetin dioxygenase-like cupin family protein